MQKIANENTRRIIRNMASRLPGHETVWFSFPGMPGKQIRRRDDAAQVRWVEGGQWGEALDVGRLVEGVDYNIG